MKKTKKLISNLLLELEKTPLIQIACDKVNISRNSLYRWMKNDPRLLDQVNEAISIGTGLVNDVAVSNVLSGIKAKDVKYTMYWLDRKHPDFRRPYLPKIDSNDILQYKRILDEKEQVMRVEMEAEDLAKRPSEEKMAIAMKEVEEWQAGWTKDLPTEEEKELFRQWKKEKKQKE